MGSGLFYMTALSLISGVVMVSAQPGPITTSNNSNLVFAASTLLTNGLPGLTGPPVTLMVATVQSNSAQGGTVSLVGSQAWVRRFNGAANSEDQAYATIADKDGIAIRVTGTSETLPVAAKTSDKIRSDLNTRIGTPVIVGPHMFNFAQATQLALEAKAAIQVTSVSSAIDAALDLLRTKNRIQEMCEAGRALMRTHQGATQRILTVLGL